jgi:hypothetical protein
MHNQRFTVEFERRVVGIAVRFAGGFTFFSSDVKFDELDGHTFPRARTIARRLEQISSRKDRRFDAGRTLATAT